MVTGRSMDRVKRRLTRAGDGASLEGMPAEAVGSTRSCRFVGRTEDLASVRGLLLKPGVSVVTLLGPPGVGKTRLAVEVATSLDAFPDGVVSATLAEVDGATGVASAILGALGLDDVGPRPAIERAVSRIGAQAMLLFLDNFEHVVDAGELVAELVDRCPNLTVLTTSRRALSIRAEQCFVVQPLAVPPRNSAPEGARRADAVALLAERIRSVHPGFEPDDRSLPVLVDICRAVDGLPLALELVAARTRSLPLEEVRDALQRRLPILTAGSRDLPRRQRTMQDAIEWSYGLLDDLSAAVFRRLSVFAASATISAISSVVADLAMGEVQLLDALAELTGHSLLVPVDDGGTARFRMLAVIREFAADRLAATGEEPAARQRHAEHFLTVAEEAAPQFTGPRQVERLDCIHRDTADFVAAVRWAISNDRADTALRLCLALRFVWYVRGPLADARRLFGAALAVPGASDAIHARALVEASALARHHVDYGTAQALAEQALAVASKIADRHLRAAALLQHGFVLHLRGDYAQARTSLEECLALNEESGDEFGTALAMHHLGLVAHHGEGDPELAWDLLCRCVALLRREGNERHLATVLIAMAELARARGDLTVAHQHLAEAAGYVTRLGDTPLLVYALHYAGALAFDEGHTRRALRLVGAAEAFEQASGAAAWPVVQAGTDRWLPRATGLLGRPRADALRAAARGLTFSEAVTLVAGREDGLASDPLTDREREIAAMVADGLTNGAIARQLVVSERTVEGHVAHVLSKLGFASRTQIATWFIRRGVAG